MGWVLKDFFNFFVKKVFILKGFLFCIDTEVLGIFLVYFFLLDNLMFLILRVNKGKLGMP